MRPLIRSTLVGTVMLPAVLTISGWAAGAAAASAPPPAITITAGNHGAPSAPASPEPAMPGMDMSGSGAADPTMPWMDMSGADGSGSMPGMDMGTGSPGSVPPSGHPGSVPGHSTGSASSPGSRAFILGGFAAVNASVLLVAAVLRRRNPARRAVAPPRRTPVGRSISHRPAIAADARAHPEGASS